MRAGTTADIVTGLRNEVGVSPQVSGRYVARAVIGDRSLANRTFLMVSAHCVVIFRSGVRGDWSRNGDPNTFVISMRGFSLLLSNIGLL